MTFEMHFPATQIDTRKVVTPYLLLNPKTGPDRHMRARLRGWHTNAAYAKVGFDGFEGRTKGYC